MNDKANYSKRAAERVAHGMAPGMAPGRVWKVNHNAAGTVRHGARARGSARKLTAAMKDPTRRHAHSNIPTKTADQTNQIQRGSRPPPSALALALNHESEKEKQLGGQTGNRLGMFCGGSQIATNRSLSATRRAKMA